MKWGWVIFVAAFLDSAFPAASQAQAVPQGLTQAFSLLAQASKDAGKRIVASQETDAVTRIEKAKQAAAMARFKRDVVDAGRLKSAFEDVKLAALGRAVKPEHTDVTLKEATLDPKTFAYKIVIEYVEPQAYEDSAYVYYALFTAVTTGNLATRESRNKTSSSGERRPENRPPAPVASPKSCGDYDACF